jgi:hypothetical protein
MTPENVSLKKPRHRKLGIAEMTVKIRIIFRRDYVVVHWTSFLRF